MNPKQAQNAPQPNSNDPEPWQEDPAQVEPTGGAGLIDPANDPLRDDADLPDADEAGPTGDR